MRYTSFTTWPDMTFGEDLRYGSSSSTQHSGITVGKIRTKEIPNARLCYMGSSVESTVFALPQNDASSIRHYSG
jgi:hypothetical protein